MLQIYKWNYNKKAPRTPGGLFIFQNNLFAFTRASFSKK